MEYKLYRYKFVKETKEYIIAKDVFNYNTYYIKRTPETEGFKVGFDNAFYATKLSKGVLFKKNILQVVNYEELVKQSTVEIAN